MYKNIKTSRFNKVLRLARSGMPTTVAKCKVCIIRQEEKC